VTSSEHPSHHARKKTDRLFPPKNQPPTALTPFPPPGRPALACYREIGVNPGYASASSAQRHATKCNARSQQNRPFSTSPSPVMHNSAQPTQPAGTLRTLLDATQCTQNQKNPPIVVGRRGMRGLRSEPKLHDCAYGTFPKTGVLSAFIRVHLRPSGFSGMSERPVVAQRHATKCNARSQQNRPFSTSPSPAPLQIRAPPGGPVYPTQSKLLSRNWDCLAKRLNSTP
jgi:hypothetical protein